MNVRCQLLPLGLMLLGSLLLASCNRAAISKSPGVPQPGFYRCWAGGFDHLPAGTLTLSANGEYESYRHGGGGRYAFSPGDSSIRFLSGDYQYWEYRGIVQPAPQAVASVSSTQSRIVLIPIGDRDPIGSERPGEYQYCYLDHSSAHR